MKPPSLLFQDPDAGSHSRRFFRFNLGLSELPGLHAEIGKDGQHGLSALSARRRRATGGRSTRLRVPLTDAFGQCFLRVRHSVPSCQRSSCVVEVASGVRCSGFLILDGFTLLFAPGLALGIQTVEVFSRHAPDINAYLILSARSSNPRFNCRSYPSRRLPGCLVPFTGPNLQDRCLPNRYPHRNLFADDGRGQRTHGTRCHLRRRLPVDLYSPRIVLEHHRPL